jgi:endonuclease YncB( thermonuclease family)
VLEGHGRPIRSVAISPDAKMVVSGSTDGVVRFWNAATGALQEEVKEHGSAVTSLAFTPDGKTLVSTGNDNQLLLWDTQTRKPRFTSRATIGTHHGVAITPDGRTMATGNGNGEIRIWDLADSGPLGDPPPADTRPRKETIRGGLAHSREDFLRITGKPKVIDGNTIAFEDGVEIDISGGMDAPPLEQMGVIDGQFYPCGQEAAEFLRKLLADKTATCYVNTKYGMKEGRENRMRGSLFVGEERVDSLMVLHGWAVADHSGMVPSELIAREKKRGLWRGTLVAPKEWRKGARLPGEPAFVPKSSVNPAVRAGVAEPKPSDLPRVVTEDGRVPRISESVPAR